MGETTGTIGNLASYLKDIGDIVTACLGWITENPVLMLIFVAGLVSIGFYVIRKAKRTAKA